MTKCVAPKCTLHCFCKGKCSRGPDIRPKILPEVHFVLFFARESARRTNTYDQICCSEVYFVLFFARESVRVANTYGPIFCPEVYFALFFDREGGGGVGMGSSWVRVGPRSPGGGGVY